MGSKEPQDATDGLLRLIAKIPRSELWKGRTVCIACGTWNEETHAESCWRVDLHHAAARVREERHG